MLAGKKKKKNLWIIFMSQDKEKEAGISEKSTKEVPKYSLLCWR